MVAHLQNTSPYGPFETVKTTFAPEKATETFGESPLTAMEHIQGFASAEGKDGDGGASMYSYSKVSQSLKEDSFMMR